MINRLLILAFWPFLSILIGCTPEMRAEVVATPSIGPPALGTIDISLYDPTYSATPDQGAPEMTPSSFSESGLASSILTNPNQVSDGALKMFLEELKPTCHKAGDAISVIVTYENLTNKPLKLVDYSIVSPHQFVKSNGYLRPVLSRGDASLVYTNEELKLSTFYNLQPPVFFTLRAGSKSDFQIGFFLPLSEAVPDEEGYMHLRLIQPGDYFLKFIYRSQRINDSWEGTISTNRIQICIRPIEL